MPMSGKYLLDTNIIIALFARDDAVINWLQNTGEVFVPSVALGELYYGAKKSAQSTENIARIDDFAINNAILNCDIETARRYGEVKYVLQLQGRPIPENDVWIAALAVQHDLILASRDKHFEDVNIIKLEKWQ